MIIYLILTFINVFHLKAIEVEFSGFLKQFGQDKKKLTYISWPFQVHCHTRPFFASTLWTDPIEFFEGFFRKNFRMKKWNSEWIEFWFVRLIKIEYAGNFHTCTCVYFVIILVLFSAVQNLTNEIHS